VSPDRRLKFRPSAAWSRVQRVVDHPANRGHAPGAVVHYLTCEVRARVTGKPVVVPIGDHSSVLAYLHLGGSWRAVLGNPPDAPEMRAWRRILRPGDRFVDVGAHVGLYTLWALDAGASVIAVEPNPDAARQLRANLERNGYAADVVEAALGATPGRMAMAGQDLLRQHLVLEDAPADGDGSVEVRVLDDVVADQSVRGLKIDVEGAERLVLEGAHRLIADARIDVMQLEWNDCSLSLLGEDRGPLATVLESAGFVLARPDDAGILHATGRPGFGADVFAVAKHAGVPVEGATASG
jgi:FkbM family methyltransferase